MYKNGLTLLILSIYTFMLLPVIPSLAQDLTLPSDSDRIPPVIKHQSSEQAAATGKPMIIKATITDNAAIKEAALYYRPMGNAEYFNVNMKAEGNNVYSATIPADDVIEPGIEYYIQVSDKAGNMVLRGFSFSPLTVMVEPVLPFTEPEKESPVVTPAKPSLEKEESIIETPPVERHVYKTEGGEKTWYKKWWVWSIVGGGAVAVAAALSIRDDNDVNKVDSAGAQNKGAVVISAPVP